MSAASILPVSDLRNYNEVLKNCQIGQPVFLTKNGRGRFVVMDIEDYERDKVFIDGKYSRETFWELAKFKYPTHQISFHTAKALTTLKFLEGAAVYEK